MFDFLLKKLFGDSCEKPKQFDEELKKTIKKILNPEKDGFIILRKGNEYRVVKDGRGCFFIADGSEKNYDNITFYPTAPYTFIGNWAVDQNNCDGQHKFKTRKAAVDCIRHFYGVSALIREPEWREC